METEKTKRNLYRLQNTWRLSIKRKASDKRRGADLVESQNIHAIVYLRKKIYLSNTKQTLDMRMNSLPLPKEHTLESTCFGKNVGKTLSKEGGKKASNLQNQEDTKPKWAVIKSHSCQEEET